MRTVKYFKINEYSKNINSIFKLIQKSEFKNNKLNSLQFDIYHYAYFYSGSYISTNSDDLILSVQGRIENKYSLKLIPMKGTVFLIENNHKDLLGNFRGHGIFTYTIITILKNLCDHMDKTNLQISFMGATLNDGFETNIGELKKRNNTYERMGFKLHMQDDANGFIGSTHYNNLNLNPNYTNNMQFYNNCNNLLNDLIDTIYFVNEIAYGMPRMNLIHAFITHQKTIKDASLPISKIIGLNHSKYKNRAWIDIIKDLRSPGLIKDLKCEGDSFDTIKYYYDKIHRKKANKGYRDPWSVEVYNNDAYITKGHHRTIISKFLFTLDLIPDEMIELDYVEYNEYNEKLFKDYKLFIKKIKTLYPYYFLNDIIDIEVEKKSLSKSINKNVTIEKFETIYRIVQERGRHLDGSRYFKGLIFDSFSELKKYVLENIHSKSIFWKLMNSLKKIGIYIEKRMSRTNARIY